MGKALRDRERLHTKAKRNNCRGKSIEEKIGDGTKGVSRRAARRRVTSSSENGEVGDIGR